MNPRIIAIIQARMGSSRLPGKVLLEIAGQPMLTRVVERTRRAKTVAEVVVATTTNASENPIAGFCKKRGYAFTRGSLYDVLDRYYQTAQQFQANIVVRITGDCPVIDPALIDETVDILLNQYDLTCNRLPPPWHRTYPIGLDTEVCTFAALEHAWNEAKMPHQREHVMPYLYEGVHLSPLSPQLSTGVSLHGFRVALLNHDPDYGGLRWTVDTHEDLEFIRQVYTRFSSQDDFTWLDILDLIKQEPELAHINVSVKHKGLHDVDERSAGRSSPASSTHQADKTC